jgi:hypothetical protein
MREGSQQNSSRPAPCPAPVGCGGGGKTSGGEGAGRLSLSKTLGTDPHQLFNCDVLSQRPSPGERRRFVLVPVWWQHLRCRFTKRPSVPSRASRPCRWTR